MIVLLLTFSLLMLLFPRGQQPKSLANPMIMAERQGSPHPTAAHRAPRLGADLLFTEWPHLLIEGWQDHAQGDEMAAAFAGAGLKTLRLSFAGLYSPRGPEATAAVKAENKLTNQYPWFSFDDYIEFVAAHDFTTVVGINVEEGPEVAFDVIKRFIARASVAKLAAVELSNEPHLNHRPWLPEEFGKRAADVIESLTPLGVRFALPLTVGKETKTPTRLSDNEWTARMLRTLSTRIDLHSRSDVYGALHLYSRGVGAGVVKIFKRAVRPFAPRMPFLVTEFNIRSSLAGNPHLTNAYAMELARKLAGLMAAPDIEAMYIHAVPYHSIMYWANGKRIATVIGQRDAKLSREQMARGWHLTPAGKVYQLYSGLAWNGDVLMFHDAGKQSYWAVRNSDGRVVVTLLNDSDNAANKTARVDGREVNLTARSKSIACYDLDGREIEELSLHE